MWAGIGVSLLGVFQLAAVIIPADRVGSWTPGVTVGVPGGIEQYLPGGIKQRTNIIDVTKPPYNADKTGASDATAAIQSAVNSAPANSVIYLPAGTYRFDSGVLVDPWHGRGDLTIRGAGTNTLIKPYGNAVAFNVSSSAGYDYQASIIVSGLTKGSTSITVSNTPWYPVGSLVHLSIPDTTNVFSVYGFPNNRKQKAIIKSISGKTLTISPPIYDNYPAGTKIEFSQFQVNRVGLEDFAVDSANSTQAFPLQFGQSYGCWMKGVQIRNAANYCVYISDSLNFEMRECVIGPSPSAASNHSGLLHNSCSGSLVENTIFTETFPLIEINFGSSGNVFAYNLFDKGTANINHAPHNFLNLFEGNIGVNFQSDGYFGGASQETFFRNWFSGNYKGTLSFIGSLNRFARQYNLVGNIFGCTNFNWSSDPISCGNPNMGNSSFQGFQSNNMWADWDQTNNRVKSWTGVLTTRSSETAGVITLTSPGIISSLTNVMAQAHSGRQFGASFANFVTVGAVSGLTIAISQASSPLPALGASVYLNPSPAGFQELDLDVQRTLLRKGNYNHRDKAIPVAESLGGEELPVSLFRTNKPAFFGSLAWPPIDPTNPNAAYSLIPAGYRYVFGTNPPPALDSIPPPPSNLRKL